MMYLANFGGTHKPREYACFKIEIRKKNPQVRLQRILVTGALTASAGRPQGARRRLGAFRWIAPVVLMLVLAMVPFAAPQAAGTLDAGAFIEDLGTRAIEQVVAPDVEPQERERRFRILLADNLNIEMIGRFVLGRYWRKASVEERSTFLDVFLEATVQRFTPILTKYPGERLRVGAVRQNPTDPTLLTVTSQLIRPQGEPFNVDWRVRRNGGRYEVVDVVAEGVSMAITLRAEYGSFIQRHGGGVRALTRSLREKLKTSVVAANSNERAVPR